MEQPVVPNANEFEQREKPNECESNMPHGANSPTVLQPTHSTVEKHPKSTVKNNEYSSLASTIPVRENEYSRLNLR